jgi:cobalamin transport system ATP-binding protein
VVLAEPSASAAAAKARETPGGATLEVEGLGQAYGRRSVLEEIRLRVEPGEIVGLLGPNGSGKSTLVKTLSGVLAHYRGSIRLDGRELRTFSRREAAQVVAVVPQETSFSFPFTALEVVLMGRHPHLGLFAFESDHDFAVARGALERCAASHLASRPIQELSSGERQRVVFARAMAQEARLLVLDEAVSFLDIRHQIELYDLVRELAEQQKTSVLTVLHDLSLAAEYCDRVYLLRDGRIDTAGPTDEVFTYTNLTRVFETDIYVALNDITGKLLVAPMSRRAREKRRVEEPPGRATQGRAFPSDRDP